MSDTIYCECVCHHRGFSGCQDCHCPQVGVEPKPLVQWTFGIDVLRHPLFPDRPVHLHRLYRDGVFAAASQIHEGLVPEICVWLNEYEKLKAQSGHD